MVNTCGRVLVQPVDKGHGDLFYCPLEPDCKYSQPDGSWRGWKKAEQVLTHVRQANKKAELPDHSTLPALCTVGHQPKYATEAERSEARRASDRKRRKPADSSTNLEQDPARLLLAAAVDARDKATAVQALRSLLQASPDVLEDRDKYSIFCSSCKVELRIVNWQVGYVAIIPHPHKHYCTRYVARLPGSL